MKDLIQAELNKQRRPELKRLALAECLQHLILQSFYRHQAFRYLVFTGGTALRLLYHTNRYSEDLDFSLPERGSFFFQELLEKIEKDLALQGISCQIQSDEKKTVWNAEIRFAGLLYEFNLSKLKDQKLMVKLEIDTRPPAGGVKELAAVTAPISYSVAVYDLQSLFATKLHAIFYRTYAKGRDYYDLMWFLGKGVKPNFKLLNNAIEQTQGKGHEIDEGEFKKRLLARLEKIDFPRVRGEVERFLINQEELKLLDLDQITSLLRNYS